MTNLESYVVAVMFIGIAGFTCGHGARTIELANARALGKPSIGFASVPGVLSVLVVFVYGLGWGFITDGPHFIWVPALIVWLFSFVGGKKFAYRQRAVLVPWRLPIAGTALVAIGYHLLAPHVSK